MNEENISLKEFYDARERIARLEEQRVGAEKALNLANDVLNTYKDSEKEWRIMVTSLEKARNESVGKSSGFNASWGIIVVLVGVGLTAITAVIGVAAFLLRPH